MLLIIILVLMLLMGIGKVVYTILDFHYFTKYMSQEHSYPYCFWDYFFD